MTKKDPIRIEPSDNGYRFFIGRHFLLCSMDHGIKQGRFAMSIRGRMEFAQISFALLDRSVQQWHGSGFSPLTMQIRNWMFRIKAQVTDLHIEKLTASGGGIVHEDHKYQISQFFGLRRIRLLKQCS